MFYFYSGEKPENPCEKCGFYKDNDCTIYDTELLCPKFKTYAAEQSIIDKLVEVNLNKMLKEYEKYKHNLGGNCVSGYEIPMPFEQFIQQQMEGEQGK